MLISALISAAAAVAGSLITYYSMKNNNESNEKINQQNLDYNTAQTQAAWERDDNAHQREVADLQKAGLSPLASTNGLSVSSPLGAPTPIAMQAPQLDTSALVNSITNMASIEEQKRHNMVTEEYRSSELQLEAERVSQEAEKLNIENKKVESEIKYYARLNELEAKKIDETIRNHKKTESLQLSEHEARLLEHQSKMFLEDITRQTGGKDIPYYEVYDLEIYANAKKLYNLKLQHFIEKIGATQTAKGESYGYNQSDSLGLGAGAKVAGTGGNGNLDWSETTGENTSTYSMENLSDKQKAMWFSFLQDNKCPVFIDKSKYDKLYK